MNDDTYQQLDAIVEQNHTSLSAIGECGIDGTIAEQHDNMAAQITAFNHQLALAKSYDLPVIVHHRKSHQQVTSLLKQAQLSKGGIVHAFSGSYQQAKAYLDMGFKLGIGGTITYERAKRPSIRYLNCL